MFMIYNDVPMTEVTNEEVNANVYGGFSSKFFCGDIEIDI